MVISVSFLIENQENFPSPPIDLGGELDPVINFPSVYGNDDFGFTVVFSVEDDLEGAFVVGDVEVITNPFYTDALVSSNNSVRIEKNEDNPFAGEFFQYVSFDESFNPTIENLEPDDAGPEQSIIKWFPPPTKLLSDELYSFKLIYLNSVTSASEEIIINIFQDVHWNLNLSINRFQNAFQESRY
jgi:hypothetical protein